MKFTAKQATLHRGLSIVSHAVPQKATFPIEKYLLATIEDGRVRLSARREDIGIHYWVDADAVEGEEAALLPAHLLADFVRNVPAAPIVVTAPSPTHPDSCHVCCLRSCADMKNASDDPAEFPTIPTFAQGGERLMQLDAELLKQIIRQIAFAAADKEHSAWSWTIGFRIEIGQGEAMFAATDSFRLAIYTLPIPDDRLQCTFLVPAKTMEELAKLLPSEGTVHLLLTPGRNMALFHVEAADRCESLDLSTRLLNYETLPNVRQAVPAHWTTRAIIGTQELAATVKLMLPYAHENGDTIRFKLIGEQTERNTLVEEPHTMSLETVAQDMGTIVNVVSAHVDGPDQELSLRATYLSEMLATIDTSQVALEVIASHRPVAMKPLGRADVVYVMTPLHREQSSPKLDSTPERNIGAVPVATQRS